MRASDFPVWVQAMLGVSGLFWVTAYALAIRRGAIDRVPAIPLFSVGTNFSWEFIHSFIAPHPFPIVIVNYCWVAMDCYIVWQVARLGREEVAPQWRRLFPLGLLALFATGAGLMWCLLLNFKDEGTMGSFVGNAVMSVLFIAMLLRRRSVLGQSMVIAVSKFIGTLVVAIAFLQVMTLHPLLLLSMVVGTVADLTYIGMLAHQYKLERIPLWSRV